MKLLHTSDWHVGKTIRGKSRADEHRAVLAEIVGVADEHRVDLVLVAGDLFETAAPTPESEAIVYRALLDLANTGAQVAVISGNHDNARRLEAVTPVLEAAGPIHLATRVRRPDEGGVLRLDMRSGESVALALLPFVSKRGIIRAEQLWDNEAFESSQQYTERITRLLAALADEFAADTINLLMAHTFIHQSALGGGERAAHFIEDYAISAPSLPITANYIALGHVHKPQRISAGSPTHYCGAPLQLDFGETGQQKQVNLVELSVGAPGAVTAVPLKSGRRLVRLRGTFDEVVAAADDVDEDAWLQVEIDEARRAGLADDVRDRIGERVVEVRMVGAVDAPRRTRGESRMGKPPAELFATYLAEQGIADGRMTAAFQHLLDEHLDRASGRTA